MPFRLVCCLIPVILVEALVNHIHLGTMLLIVVLWFGISAPLSAIGAYFGSKHGVRLVCSYFEILTNIGP